MITKKQIKIFDEKIRAANTIVLCGHKNPDGDALCSVLALAHLIELNYGKQVLCLYDGNIPDYLDLVPLRKNVYYFAKVEKPKNIDVAIVLDYGAIKNIGGPKGFVDSASFVIEVDHHINNDGKIGELCIDDTSVSAAAEIVYHLMISMGWVYDEFVLDLLMTGIITDTGNFKFIKNGRVLRATADLVDKGVNIQKIMDGLLNKARKTVLVESMAAGRAEFFFKNRLAFAYIDAKEYRNLDGRGETVLWLLQQIHGVDYVVLLKEQKPGQIGISLRSRAKPVNKIAETLGGGGHEFAAGAVVMDSLENVKARVLKLFQEVIK
ncbi:MAG: DHH family phosphoesterase [Alphaproteobacteria bacterium]|nr:DHH family phosphoesterase [Alphaproteobacteria bacterium]